MNADTLTKLRADNDALRDKIKELNTDMKDANAALIALRFKLDITEKNLMEWKSLANQMLMAIELSEKGGKI